MKVGIACSIAIFVCSVLTTQAVAIETLSVNVESGVSINVEVTWPRDRVAKAIVLFVPGSGGLSDPDFEIEISEPVYNPESRGGFTKKLVEAGFGVAFYNQRGYRPLRYCVRGRDGKSRAESFVRKCIDESIRKNVRLSTVSEDTAAVYGAIERLGGRKGVPVILLATSEGMYHAAKIVGSKSVAPVGIVTIGGPIGSMRDVFVYQANRVYIFDIVERSLIECGFNIVSYDTIRKCNGAEAIKFSESEFVEAVGGTAINKGAVAARREFWRVLYEQADKEYGLKPAKAILPGRFMGLSYENGWSGWYLTDILAANTSILELLNGYRGRVIYLFGGLDHRVKVPVAGLCAIPDSGANSNNCRIEIIPGLGHGLDDSSGRVSEYAFSRINDALNEVLCFSKYK